MKHLWISIFLGVVFGFAMYETYMMGITGMNPIGLMVISIIEFIIVILALLYLWRKSNFKLVALSILISLLVSGGLIYVYSKTYEKFKGPTRRYYSHLMHHSFKSFAER